MKIKFLGSGGWEGIPAPFCDCRVCELARKSNSKNNRTRPEILIETKKGKSDPDHLHGKQILDFISLLNAKKVIFHSITHLTEKTHEELQALFPKDMELSFDGMEIIL